MTVQRLVYIADDRSIGLKDDVYDESLLNIDESLLNWIPQNVHALQWYGEYGGEIEYRADSPSPWASRPANERISELGEWEKLVEIFYDIKKKQTEKFVEQQLAIESQIDYWAEFRIIRNYLLTSCDWTQLPDSPLTPEQVSAWAVYRQQLRELPETDMDPKIMVFSFRENDPYSEWPISPQ